MQGETDAEAGSSEGSSDPMVVAREYEHERWKIERNQRFQLHVLYVFVGVIGLIMLFDTGYFYLFTTSIWDRLEHIMTVILPIFTFLLGMGTSRTQPQ